MAIGNPGNRNKGNKLWGKRATKEDVDALRAELAAFMRETGLAESELAKTVPYSKGTLYNIMHMGSGTSVPVIQMTRAAMDELRAHPEKRGALANRQTRPRAGLALAKRGAPDSDALREEVTKLIESGLSATTIWQGAGWVGSSIMSMFRRGRGLSDGNAKKLRDWLARQNVAKAMVRQQRELPHMPQRKDRVAVVAARLSDLNALPHASHDTHELVTLFINKVGLEAIQTLLLIAQSQQKKEGE